MRPWMGLVVLVALFGAAPGAFAQQSASFRLEESVFNGGGAPGEDGSTLTSTSYRITLASIAEGVARAEISSPSFGMSAGFVNTYPAPGEVEDLRFADDTTLRWQGARSAGTYNLYRDLVSALAGLGFGQCEQQGIDTNSTTDNATAPAGDAFFYLVTVQNRLGEEGGKGNRSDGTERGGTACP